MVALSLQKVPLAGVYSELVPSPQHFFHIFYARCPSSENWLLCPDPLPGTTGWRLDDGSHITLWMGGCWGWFPLLFGGSLTFRWHMSPNSIIFVAHTWCWMAVSHTHWNNMPMTYPDSHCPKITRSRGHHDWAWQHDGFQLMSLKWIHRRYIVSLNMCILIPILLYSSHRICIYPLVN